MKLPKYKCGKVTPMLYDVVNQNGREVVVTEIRLDPSAGFCNCSFGEDGNYRLTLDTPWTVDFIRRGN